MKSLCVIPAREGSKTIPKKNIKMVGGKPLIGYAIEAVLESKVFDRIILSTDSEEIAEVVRRHYQGVEIPFIRDSALATDSAPLIGVAKHAMEFFDGAGERFDAIFSVQPTNPLTKPKTLADALKLIKQTDCDSVVTITKILHFHPFRAYRYDSSNMSIQPLTEYTKESFLQKQDRPEAYGMTGAIFGRKPNLLRRWRGAGFALGKERKGIVVSQEEALDIDTPFDLELFKGIVFFRKREV